MGTDLSQQHNYPISFTVSTQSPTSFGGIVLLRVKADPHDDDDGEQYKKQSGKAFVREWIGNSNLYTF